MSVTGMHQSDRFMLRSFRPARRAYLRPESLPQPPEANRPSAGGVWPSSGENALPTLDIGTLDTINWCYWATSPPNPAS